MVGTASEEPGFLVIIQHCQLVVYTSKQDALTGPDLL